MGFTPLDGLMMGTRSGSLDPGILTYLMREENSTGKQLDTLLNTKSGLLGISGISGDMRQIVTSIRKGNPRAKLAFDMFVHHLQSGIGAMMASLGPAQFSCPGTPHSRSRGLGNRARLLALGSSKDVRPRKHRLIRFASDISRLGASPPSLPIPRDLRPAHVAKTPNAPDLEAHAASKKERLHQAQWIHVHQDGGLRDLFHLEKCHGAAESLRQQRALWRLQQELEAMLAFQAG